MPRIVRPNKGAFVKGRQIMENIILIQESIHSSLQHKEKRMVVKIDLENAFDGVKHNFLFADLKQLGFT